MEKLVSLNDSNVIMINDCIRMPDDIVKKETYYYEGETYRPNWYKYNDTWYYFKGIDRIEFFINEVLGSMIAKYLNLPTVTYKLGKREFKYDSFYGIMSPNFKEEKMKYVDGFSIANTKVVNKPSNLKIFKKICWDQENYNSLVSDFLKKCALEIYTSQVDGVACNTYFQIDGKKTSLAPLFDYSASFNTLIKNSEYDFTNIYYSYTYSYPENLGYKEFMYKYGNFIFTLDIPSKEFTNLTKLYPSFRDSFFKLLTFNTKEALDEIEDTYKIVISDRLKGHYIEECNNKNKLLRRVL